MSTWMRAGGVGVPGPLRARWIEPRPSKASVEVDSKTVKQSSANHSQIAPNDSAVPFAESWTTKCGANA